MEYITHSTIETEQLGMEFASKLKAGDYVALYGDLGVGKTAFTRGMSKVLCPGVRVQSPTFAIVNAYKGKIPVYHFDMYRITSEESLYSCGFFDYLENGGICISEWSENIESFIPEDAYRVKISKVDYDENIRKVEINK